MYNATGRKTIEECAKRAIDLLQLIASAREVRGEDKVRQLIDTRREAVLYNSSEACPVLNFIIMWTHQSWNRSRWVRRRC